MALPFEGAGHLHDLLTAANPPHLIKTTEAHSLETGSDRLLTPKTTAQMQATVGPAGEMKQL